MAAAKFVAAPTLVFGLSAEPLPMKVPVVALLQPLTGLVPEVTALWVMAAFAVPKTKLPAVPEVFAVTVTTLLVPFSRAVTFALAVCTAFTQRPAAVQSHS